MAGSARNHASAGIAPQTTAPQSLGVRQAGHSLIETMIALAVTAVATTTGLTAAASFADTMELRLARRIVIRAMLSARRDAYRLQLPLSVQVPEDAGRISADDGRGGSRTSIFPEGITVGSAPRDESVRFLPGGLADNATILLRSSSGSQASVIINQRGRVR